MYLFMEKYTSDIMKCINQCDASKHIIFVIQFSNNNSCIDSHIRYFIVCVIFTMTKYQMYFSTYLFEEKNPFKYL